MDIDIARGVAARVWCDHEMGNQTMDVVLAEEIAQLLTDRLGQPSVGIQYQYYHKVTGCKANNPDATDCICWHNEGDFPYPEQKHDDGNGKISWRTTPISRGVTS